MPECFLVRVLVVDDSAFMRKAISQALACDPSIEVVGTACNGQDGLDKAKKLAPDVVTLDIEMPVMDGMAALIRIRTECPEPKPAVLMCSTLTSAGSHEALKALRLGAADVIAKDPQALGAGSDSARGELVAKVKAVGEPVVRQRMAMGLAAPTPPAARPVRSAARPDTGPLVQAPRSVDLSGKTFDLVVIGSSTGGPPAGTPGRAGAGEPTSSWKAICCLASWPSSRMARSSSSAWRRASVVCPEASRAWTMRLRPKLR